MVVTVKRVENAYISCACNRSPHEADWGFNGLLCYGACNSVTIYDPKAGGGGRALLTLTGHKGRVNSVKWIKTSQFVPEIELVSVSSDQCGLIWRKFDGTYAVTSVLKGHEGSVTAVDAICTTAPEPTLLVATASVDSTVRIWERVDQEGVVCVHVVSLGPSICLSLRLAKTNTWLLACALDDCNVHLYTETDRTVTRQQMLSGHDDWVAALDFTIDDDGDLLLASGSLDSTVRLWRFQTPRTYTDDRQFHVEEKRLSVGGKLLAVSLESVLLGHEGRVYSVHWHPPTPSKGQPMKLLTSSLDKTVVVWSPEAQTGVWLEEARMGEVGGNTLGFYGAHFSTTGNAIIAHTYLGGFHLWHKYQKEWKPGVTVGGHYDAVMDLAWEPKHGRYVLSVSSDQTTRLHAPWISDSSDKIHSWHEIARPQIHGYDLVCLAMMPGFRFASGADEKVIRAFTAPQNFLENFRRLCLKNVVDGEVTGSKVALPRGAAVPVLGLSNKAVYQTETESQPVERHIKDQYDDNSYFTPQCLVEPPTEDNLLQNTLWPEATKLYGHGYEVFSLATSSDGSLLASACKATNEKHAAILLWDTSTWQKLDRLVSHQLTVTQMAFSPDDQYLLSVSRDRRWSLFRRSASNNKQYKLATRSDKTNGIHTRIIWCCAWSHNGEHFATGSRDGKLVMWGKDGGASSDYLDLPKESITSVAFSPQLDLPAGQYLLAIGSETGDIRLYGWEKQTHPPWMFLFQLSGNSAHHLSVKKLAFCPVLGKAGSTSMIHEMEPTQCCIQLASCGLDNTLKICDMYISKS